MCSRENDVILNMPLVEFNLSVRVRNCFRAHKISLVNDLITKTEEELLSYRNFGKTSLKEVKRFLVEYGLSLNERNHNLITPKVISKGNALLLQKLQAPIEELRLSVRSYNCLSKAGIRNIGELIERKECELLTIRNFGRKSLAEIKKLLFESGLTLGTLFSSADYITPASPIVNTDSDKLISPQSFESCLEYIYKYIVQKGALREVLNDRKLILILEKRLLAKNKLTLDQLGAKLLLTRERVRQLETKAIKRLYGELDISNKIYITAFFNQIMKQNGMKVLINKSYINKTEFNIFNVLLKLKHPETEFDDTYNTWVLRKKTKILKGIEKFLENKYKSEYLYPLEGITTAIAQYFANIVLPKEELDCLMRNVVANYFIKVNNLYAFQTTSDAIIFAYYIKKYYPHGIELKNDIDEFIAYLRKEGFSELVSKKKRALIAGILRSDDLVLWGWGVYIHKDNIRVSDLVLRKVDSWLHKKFQQGIRRVSLWGAFSALQDNCERSGIPNEHALYSCMKLKYSRKYYFSRDPHVYKSRQRERQTIGSLLDSYLRNVDTMVSLRQIMDGLGLKDYQVSQHIGQVKEILACNNNKFVHSSKIRIKNEDIDFIIGVITKKLDRYKHINVKGIFSDNILLCKKNDIMDSRLLYSFLFKEIGDRFYFPRYPYILREDHGFTSDGRFSLNDIVAAFFEGKKRLVYYKELYEYFVQERGYTEAVINNLCYLCEDIMQYTTQSYISLDALSWNEEKAKLLERIAIAKFQDYARVGYPFVLIDDLLEEALPQINKITPVSWQRRLLSGFLERNDKIRLIGSTNNIYIVILNSYNIHCTDDLVYFILRKEFYGATNKEKFLKRLQQLRITKKINSNARNYKIVNEEVIARSGM